MNRTNEAFFFGPPSSQLLGVYHAPKPGRDRYAGIVLCYPFGQEYMRAHRAFRHLARLLSSKGLHVLRFDYRGTGDSAGGLDAVTAEDWLEDIQLAVQELEGMTGVNRVALMGLRLGGLLAGFACAGCRSVSSLILWDPVVAGNEYQAELEARIKSTPVHKRRSNFIERNGDLHSNGFHMPVAFQRSLSDRSLLDIEPHCRRILQLVSHESEMFFGLAQRWKHLKGYEYRHVPAEHDWNYVDHVGGILLPSGMLHQIAEWL